VASVVCKNVEHKTPIAGITTLLLVLAVLFCVISPVSADSFSPFVSTHIDTTNAVPSDIWLLSGVLGFILFYLSLGKDTASTADLERDALISIIAWVPIAFTAYSSFAVDRITSSGVIGVSMVESHTIYSFTVIGILFAVFFLIAIVNTIRILSLRKELKGQVTNVEYKRGGVDE
jgi:hypothetical protein